MNRTALIIEDDPQLAELIQIQLNDINFKSSICHNGIDGLQQAKNSIYKIILLDLMLPGIDGLEICKSLRKEGVNTPIIMLTSKSEEIDKVIGLESGADDYITKPFSMRELQARVKAIIRRSDEGTNISNLKKDLLSFTNLAIDLDKRTATKNNDRLDLTQKEFELLMLLAGSPGKSFSRQELLNLVWGYEFEGLEHTVNSHINRIRAKIENDMANPEYILTTWGYGYRFNENI